MADRIAAVLAGVPGRIINGVLESLRESFPDLLVVRGRGARSYASGLAAYPNGYIAEIISLAGDAIFGESGRPKGFCRNPQRACLRSGWSKTNCGARDDLACGREKPEKFVLFIQQADEENTSRIVDAFRNVAFIVVIPRDAYDHLGRTSLFIEEALKGLEDELSVAKANIKSSAPSLLLPVKNFGHRDLKRLVKRAVIEPTTRRDLRAFRTKFFKEETYFRGRSKLAFQPTVEETAHGTPDSDEDVIAAIGAHYRAGCRFDDFHWDVYPTGGSGWGSTTISCWKRGDYSPDSKHANVLVDDRLR